MTRQPASIARQRDINDSESVFRNTRSPFDRAMYLFVKLEEARASTGLCVDVGSGVMI